MELLNEKRSADSNVLFCMHVIVKTSEYRFRYLIYNENLRTETTNFADYLDINKFSLRYRSK